MSIYEPQAWQVPARQTSWEQPAPPSRTGMLGTAMNCQEGGTDEKLGMTPAAQREEVVPAFGMQVEGTSYDGDQYPRFARTTVLLRRVSKEGGYPVF